MTFVEWKHAVVVLDDLPAALRRERLAKGESIRSAARQIGISFSTLDRFERKSVLPNGEVIRSILVWLAKPGEHL